MKTAIDTQNSWAAIERMPVVVFDLDGTLIDSRQAILDCWTDALKRLSLTSQVLLDERLIGPPAREIARLLVGPDNADQAELLFESFVESYDEWGWQRCLPFPDVDQKLRRMASSGTSLHLVTNKRAVPTTQILNSLGWLPLFGGVYCSDQYGYPARSKAQLIVELIAEWGINPKKAAYIGDTPQDRTAAMANGLRFLAAWWGDAAHHFPEAFVKAA